MRGCRKLLLQGGVSTGRTYEEDCEVVRNLPEATPAARAAANSDRFCRTQSPFLTQVKMLGAYTLPYDIQLSGTFQTSPGPEVTASGTFVNAQVVPSLGRNLSTGTSVSVGLVEPKTAVRRAAVSGGLPAGEAVQLRTGRASRRRWTSSTRLNGNTVLVQSNTYGATTGAAAGSVWLRPQAILPARIVKFGVQVNF